MKKTPLQKLIDKIDLQLKNDKWTADLHLGLKMAQKLAKELLEEEKQMIISAVNKNVGVNHFNQVYGNEYYETTFNQK